jgi:hypothetical protein
MFEKLVPPQGLGNQQQNEEHMGDMDEATLVRQQQQPSSWHEVYINEERGLVHHTKTESTAEGTTGAVAARGASGAEMAAVGADAAVNTAAARMSPATSDNGSIGALTGVHLPGMSSVMPTSCDPVNDVPDTPSPSSQLLASDPALSSPCGSGCGPSSISTLDKPLFPLVACRASPQLAAGNRNEEK